MTVITVTGSDAGRITNRWAIPSAPILNETPIPRGLREYRGTVAIAALGANDETNVVLTFSFPLNYIYIPKTITLAFASDDLTTEFDNIGVLEYRPAADQSIGVRITFELLSSGSGVRNGVSANQNYRPEGTWRRFINGPNLDTMVFFLSDISNDTSTAGDVSWQAEFWEYDIAQYNKWPINTPIPQLSY